MQRPIKSPLIESRPPGKQITLGIAAKIAGANKHFA